MWGPPPDLPKGEEIMGGVVRFFLWFGLNGWGILSVWKDKSIVFDFQ